MTEYDVWSLKSDISNLRMVAILQYDDTCMPDWTYSKIEFHADEY